MKDLLTKIASAACLTVCVGASSAVAQSVTLMEVPIDADAVTDNAALANAKSFQLLVDSGANNLLSVDATIDLPSGAAIYNDANESGNDGEPNAALINIVGFRSLRADSYFFVWENGGGSGTGGPPTVFLGTLGTNAGAPAAFPIQLGSPLPPAPQNQAILQVTLLDPNFTAGDKITGKISTSAPGSGTPIDLPFDILFVPEPASLALLGLGGLAMLRRRA